MKPFAFDQNPCNTKGHHLQTLFRCYQDVFSHVVNYLDGEWLRFATRCVWYQDIFRHVVNYFDDEWLRFAAS